jgi:cell division protein FtsI (penicillin-binding protein 3)
MRSTDPVHGAGIVLTIDSDIQYRAQLELAKAVKKWHAKGGSVVVMDPRDGSILAMTSTPYFDPNKFSEAEASAVRNKAACDTYEPGSTIKSLTAAAVIDKDLYTPKSKFVLPPTLQVGGRTIHESHPRGTVTWTLTDIVTNSSNIGAVKLGQALGPKGLYRAFDGFGLTERSGLDFPGDACGWMPPPKAWSASTIGNIPFGQGVSVTPLQLARAMAAIANGGEMPTPHLLQEVPDRNDVLPQWPMKRAIKAKTASTTTKMLEAVVSEGTGSGAKIEGYTVAGKTGTAQKARADGRGYAGGKYVGSFIGYLPAEDPQVLVCVTIDEPSSAIYGGVVAAPTFAAVAEFAVSHLGILPPEPRSSRSGDATVTADQ